MAVVAELEAIITADTSGFDAGVDAANQKLQELGQSSGSAADQLTQAGSMMAAAGAAILAPLVGAVKGASDFEFAMDGVNAALGGVDTATMDLLKQQALDLGQSSKFSATEIAGVQDQLAKSGLSAQDLLDGATKAVTDLAAATGEDLPTATVAAANAMNLFGLKGSDMSRVADILTGTLNQSSATLPDLQRGINNLGPVMANLNRYTEMTAQGLNGAEEAFIDTAAAVGYFNQQGLKAADAGVSLARGITNLSTPGSKASQLLTELGISAFDLNGNLIPLPDLFDQLNEKMSGMSDQAREAGLATIFGAEAADVMNQAIKKGGQPLRDFTEKLREEGIAAKQAAIRQGNLQGSVEKLGGALNGLAIQMGTPLLDPINNATQGLTHFVDMLAGAPPEVQKLVSEFGALTGGLLTVGGGAAFSAGKVLKLAEQFSKAGLSLPKFAAGLGLVGLAIGAGLLAYETNFLGFRDTVDKAMADAGKAIDVFGSAFDSSFSARKIQGINDAAAAVGAFGDALLTATGIDVTRQTQNMESAINSFAKRWAADMATGRDATAAFFDALSAGATAGGMPQAAQELSKLALAADAMQKSMTATEGKMPQLNRELSALAAAADVLTGQDVSGFFNDLGANAGQAQGDLQALADAIKSGDIHGSLDALQGDTSKLSALFDQIGTNSRTAIDDLGAFADAIKTGDFHSAADLLGADTSKMSAAFDAIGTTLSTLDLGGKLQGVSDQITTWFDDIGRQLTGGFDSMGGPGERDIKGAIPQLADNIVTGFQGLGDAVMGKLQALPNPMEGVGQWLQDGLDEVSRFFQPQEISAGLGGGVGDTSGISQMFSGMVDGIGAGMDQAITDLGALKDEKTAGFAQAIGDLLGPIGQFLFPSQDAAAAGTQMLGDPGAIGKQFGESIINTFKDPAFTEALDTSIKALPPEVFQGTGAALLGALTTGMKTAMTQAAPTTGDTSGAAGAAQTMGQQMVQTLADGLTTTLTAADASAAFIPAAQALGSTLNTALGTAMTQTVVPKDQVGPVGAQAAGGIGAQLVQSLADGLTTSLLTEGTPDKFIPTVNALGTVLNTAMQQASQQTQVPTGVSDVPAQQASGFGQQLVQGLATGLTDSITAADPALFIPVAGALGTQLGAAMSAAAQQTQAPGPTGVPTQVPGVGTGMVEGLATGLTDSITAAPPEIFQPVANALGTQLSTALQTVMTQTVGVGEGAGGPVGADAAGGIGTQMVQGLATGLGDSITAAPIETFAPVGTALGTKVTEALQNAVTQAGQTAGEGASGGAGAAQIGEALSQMLVTGTEQADFTTVGTTMGTKISEALATAAEGLGQGGASGGAGGAQIGESITSMLQSGVDGADFSGVGDSLSTQLTDQMDSAIEEVSSGISDSMSQMTEAVSEAVSQMGEAISQATEEVSQAVDEMSQSISDAVSAVSDAVSEMQSAVEDAAGAMEDAASQAVDAVAEISSAAEEAASAVESAMSSMAASVSAAAGAISAAAGEIVGALNEIAGAAGAASSAVASIPAAPSGGGGAAPAGGMSTESVSTMGVAQGEAVVTGMAAGMTSGNGAIKRSSQDLAQMSITALSDAIGMGSPATAFIPHGQAITDGMMQGMLDQAKSRLQSAIGKMAGAVSSAMGKVQSAVSSAMDRVRSQGQQQATDAGAAAASGMADGMSSEDKQAERAARQLWRKAYKELMKGKGAARFLGEEWSREFWEGMLDSSGSLEFAQYVTKQMVAAAENAVTAATAAVKGLATQLEIVASTIDSMTSDLESLQSQLDAMDASTAQAAQQAELNAVREELSLQQQITRELQSQFKTQFDAAHQAHIRAVQEGTAAAQADYESKLAIAQATDTAQRESQIKEAHFTDLLAFMQKALEQAAATELATRRAEIAAELALKQQQLDAELAMQAQLQAAQHQAQADYANAVISGSQDRLNHLQDKLQGAHDPQKRAELKGEIALEEQRLALAQQMVTALAAQANAGSPESLAQANAQIEYLTAQIEALGQVDISAMLQTIVSELGGAATALSGAASDMSSAATDLGSVDSGALDKTAQAVSDVGTAASGSTGGMRDMATEYNKVMAQMAADGYAFQAMFKDMVAKTNADAATGGEAIGTSLGTGIKDAIGAGAPAMQKTMLDSVQGGIDQTDDAADTGATRIADTFGASMRDQLGVTLPKAYTDITDGMKTAVNDTTQEASQGGKDVAGTYTDQFGDTMDKRSSKLQTDISRPVDQGLSDATHIATQGGHDVGDAMSTGIAKGVQDRSHDIASTAAQTVRDAIAAARNAANAHSASRHMIDLGDDMGLGLVLGLRGRQGDAKDASRQLVHIPSLSPTSAGGVTGRRAAEGQGATTTVHIEHLELPSVRDPEEFIAAMQTFAQMSGVASGRG